MTVWTDVVGCTPTVEDTVGTGPLSAGAATVGTLGTAGCSILLTLTGVPKGMSALLPSRACLKSARFRASSFARYVLSTLLIQSGLSP